MAKLVVVENDKVEGTDTHNVSGVAAAGAPPPAYSGTGDYDYVGKMTGGLSPFVSIDGRPVALVTSQSSLDPGEDVPPAGRHSPPAGKNFNPPAPAPNPTSLQFLPPVLGTGSPNAGAGSSFVQAGGDALLLDGDGIDTCEPSKLSANSTVTVDNQDFVSCSE